MVEISKFMFDQTCRDLDCHFLMHPWEQSCFKSALPTYTSSFIGSAKFYSLIYLAQLAMRGKKLAKKEEWAKMGEYYVRSTILGGVVCGSCSTIGCIFRLLQGRKFNYYTYIWIPATINGICIYLEPPSRRGLVINLFCNLAIEFWLRELEKKGYINLSKSKQTLLFMMGSSLLFYLMRLEGDKKEKTPLFWLFTPEKVKVRTADETEIVCPHKGSCYKHIFKGYSTYFGVGMGLSLARVVLPKLMTPVKAFSAIRAKHFKMALFFGSYIGIYRAVVCFLCRKQGGDSALYALPAGYLAGLSFLFNPSLGFAIASMTGALKLYSTILYEKKILPKNIPLPELLYCLCQGTLFHARFLHPETSPTYLFKLTQGVSNGRTDQLYANLLTAVKQKFTLS